MELINTELIKLNQELQEARKYDNLLEVSNRIFFMKIEMIPELQDDRDFMDITGEIIDTLKKYMWSTNILEYHKKLFKTVVKLSLLTLRDCSGEFTARYSDKFNEVGATAVNIHAWLQNIRHFPRLPLPYERVVLYEDILRCSLKYSEESKYFPLTIDNYIQAYDATIVNEVNNGTVTLICNNLEDNHQNIGKLLLDLFQRMLKVAKENDSIVDIPLNQLSWLNRNKFYLLSKILSNRPELLMNHKNFDLMKFLNGMRVGLSHNHLLPCSLMLVKTIYNKEPFKEKIINLSILILTHGSLDEVKIFFNTWFTAYNDAFRDEIFIKLTVEFDFTTISSTSQDFKRALLIRNGFKRPLSDQMETSIMNFYCQVDDNLMKIEIFEILLHQASNLSKNLNENLLRFFKFLTYNISSDDSNFRDVIFRKLPNFFNFLASTRFRKVEIAREIFGIVRDDLYIHGMNFGSYESKIFSLNLLNVLLKQFCGCEKGQRLSRQTDEKVNFQFRVFLKENLIWDFTSKEIFDQLEKLGDDRENKDISTLANNLLVEYFIKTLIVDEYESDFNDWIDDKFKKSLNLKDIEEYHENISYCIMKFEYLVAKKSEVYQSLLDELIVDLQKRFDELKRTFDPVHAMVNGKNLFNVIDCINYALKINKSIFHHVSDNLLPLLDSIYDLFLNFINDGKSAPSFDKLDEYLTNFIKNSKYSDQDLKHSLLLSFFFTLRSCSELSVTIVQIISEMGFGENLEIITNCIRINVEIMTRSSHKGIIEAAAFALGKITKVISHQFFQHCDHQNLASKNMKKLLAQLQAEVICQRIQSSLTGEIRGTRGVLIMAHHIIKNHPPFVKILMDHLLVLKKILMFQDTLDVKYNVDVHPIHLHLLALIIKDAELVGEMRKYYDFILLATFRKYKETRDDFIMQNALLQIIGCLVPKISNQKQGAIDESESPDYEHKSISVYEFYVKMTYSFHVALYDLELHLSELSHIYIIILLEIFSNFEHRQPFQHRSEIDSLLSIYAKLFNHKCEKIRLLAAKCYALWILPDNIPLEMQRIISGIFNKDSNLSQSSIIACRILIQRYDASVKFVKDFNKATFLSVLRGYVNEMKGKGVLPSNFYLRCYFLDFLHFIGFEMSDEIVKRTLDESTVNFSIGYSLWRHKIKSLYEKC